MKKRLNVIVIFLASLLFIWVFGFAFGSAVHLLFIDTDMEAKYGLYRYSLSKPFPGYYLGGFIFFAPFYLIVYLVMWLSRSSLFVKQYLIVFITILYFVYGILVFGGQFWHLAILFNGNFQGWFTDEYVDRFYGISSLLAVMLFVVLVRRNNRIRAGTQEL